MSLSKTVSILTYNIAISKILKDFFLLFGTYTLTVSLW